MDSEELEKSQRNRYIHLPPMDPFNYSVFEFTQMLKFQWKIASRSQVFTVLRSKSTKSLVSKNSLDITLDTGNKPSSSSILWLSASLTGMSVYESKVTLRWNLTFCCMTMNLVTVSCGPAISSVTSLPKVSDKCT